MESEENHRKYNAFLCLRQQRVVVNGFKSDCTPFGPGVPESTVLGPLLFSLHINDISSDIESEIRLFADDCVCYREIKDKEDTSKLQHDAAVEKNALIKYRLHIH